MNRLKTALLTGSTLLVGAVAGWFASRIGIPLAWMVAPLIVIGAATLIFDLPRLPTLLRYFGQIVVGNAVGLYMTPQAVQHIGANAVPIVLAAGTITLAAGLVGILQIKLTRADPATAIFSSIPGGPLDMAVMSAQHGGDPAKTAVAQTMRIAAVVLIFPSVIVFGSELTTPAAEMHGSLFSMALLLALGIAAGRFFSYMRWVNPYFMGPMIVTSLLSGVDVGLMPYHPGVVSAAQVVLGVSLGGMFRRTILSETRAFLLGILGTTLALFAICALIAEIISLLYGTDLATLLLANAPGAVPEMVLTAKALGLDVPLVASYQIVRIAIGLVLVNIFFRVYQRVARIKTPEKEPPDS